MFRIELLFVCCFVLLRNVNKAYSTFESIRKVQELLNSLFCRSKS